MIDLQMSQAIGHIAKVIKDTVPEDKQASVEREIAKYLKDFAEAIDARIDAKLQAFENNMIRAAKIRR